MTYQQSGERKTAAQRGYGARWQKYRTRYLSEHPLCVMHQELGRVVAATVVDHIQPHKGDHKLFWTPANHQPLCKHCHDRHKQRMERGSAALGCSPSGQPTDPRHHWSRQSAQGVGGKNPLAQVFS